MDSRPLIPASSHLVHEVRSSFGADNRGLLTSAYPSITAHESALRDYLRVLVKRKWIVISCFVIIPTLVLLASLRMTRIYEASGRIAINRVDTGLMSLKENSGVSDYSDPAELDTEVSILQSDLLALQVIRQLNLDRNPQFGGSATATRPAGLAPDPLMTDSAQTSALLARFHGGLRVAIRPNTRIIELRYASPDPRLAAQVVNTLAATYVEQNFKTKYESTLQASDWLSKQLVDLQMKVETSQEKLVKYQKEHEILGIDEKQNIITSKLDELNRTLTGAEADRMQKEAVYRQVEAGDPDAVAAAVGPSGAGGGSSGSSSLLDKLRGQRSDLRIQVAELSTQLGPSYPKVVQMNNQLKQVETEISAEIRKVVAGIRDQYETALQREQLLHAALEKQKQEANKLNEGAIEYTLLRRDVESNRQLYEGLLAKLKEAGVTAGLRSNNFRIVDAARVPTAPSEPNIPRNLAFAIVLGLTSGIGLAFLLESLDNTVRTTDQAQMISGLPSLGMIPLGTRNDDRKSARPLAVTSGTREAVELITQARPQSQMAESYRALRTSLLLSSLGAPPRILLITSALPQEGKTTTSINTAVVLAQKGVRVLLIDADLRRPSIHKTLGMGPRSGLSNVLTGTAELQQAIVRSTIMPNLFILPAGTPPPNPAELLASVHMKALLTQLREQYDHIVIDTPPTLSVTDAVVLSTRVDTVVLVIRSGQTTKTALRRARDLLLQVNARVTGVLLNAVDLSSPDYYYYYEYRQKYGGSYYSEDGVSTSKEDSARQASTGSV
jgi:exopolysaccharide transport family protein